MFVLCMQMLAPLLLFVLQNCVARALYDNIAESPDELAFRKGDVLTVLEQNTGGIEGWWLCSLRGRQVSLMPHASCLAFTSSRSSSLPSLMVVFSFGFLPYNVSCFSCSQVFSTRPCSCSSVSYFLFVLYFSLRLSSPRLLIHRGRS
jgi:hypothetical protein